MEEKSEWLVDVLRPTVYWVSQMMGDLRVYLENEEVREELLEYVDGGDVAMIRRFSNASFVGFAVSCRDVFEELEPRAGYMSGALEDILFEVGEISEAYRRAREIGEMAGFGTEVIDVLNDVGRECGIFS